MIKSRKVLSLILFLFLFLPGCYSVEVKPGAHSPYYPLEKLPAGSILHVPTGSLIAEGQLYSYLTGSRVVYVGEAHDNLDHHRVQLRVIKALEERFPGTVSIGLEMFRNSSQLDLDRWVRGEMEEKEFFALWSKNWGVDYDNYRDILEYARERRIPLVALNASKEQLLALNHGSVAGEEEHKSIQLPEMDMTDPYHKAMVEAVYYDPSHMTHGNDDFEKFYKVLLLWEETMAETISNHMTERGGERRMVIMSGGGHINYGYGIPKRVFRRIALPYTTILPITPLITNNKELAVKKGVKLLDVDLPSAPLYLADFVWATGYTKIETEKARLGVQLGRAEGKVEVLVVAPGSAAERGGMKKGDIIESFDGEVLEDIPELQYLVRLKEFGDEAVMEITRGEETLTMTVTFEAPEKEPDVPQEHRDH